MHPPQASKLAQSPTSSMKYALTPLDFTQLLILHTLLAILIHALQSCLWSCASLYCDLIIQGLTVLVLQQELIQEPLIAGSTLPTADCLSQDGCNSSSHPTHSSYLAIDIPPTKKHICVLCFWIWARPWLQQKQGHVTSEARTEKTIVLLPSSLRRLFFRTQLPFNEEAQATWKVHV